MYFKNWLLTEEIYDNNTATVFHRTQSIHTIQQILEQGFHPREYSLFGKGLYATLSLEYQFTEELGDFGEYIVKFKVTDLDKYLIFNPQIAKKIHGENNSKLSQQLKKFDLFDEIKRFYSYKSIAMSLPEKYEKLHQKDIEETDEYQEKYGNVANLLRLLQYEKWIIDSGKIKGAIYCHDHDGCSIVKYAPYLDKTITMLGYAKANKRDFKKMEELQNNIGWITSTNTTKIKDIQKLPLEKRKKYSSIKKPKKSPRRNF